MKWILYVENRQLEIVDGNQLRSQLVDENHYAIHQPIIALLSAPDGSSMTIGLGLQRSALAHYDPGGWPSRHVVGNAADDGLVQYMFCEQFTEIPLRYTINVENAINACVEFMTTGMINENIQWEED